MINRHNKGKDQTMHLWKKLNFFATGCLSDEKSIFCKTNVSFSVCVLQGHTFLKTDFHISCIILSPVTLLNTETHYPNLIVFMTVSNPTRM